MMQVPWLERLVVKSKMIEQPSSDAEVETLLQNFPGPIALCGQQSGNPAMLLGSLLVIGITVPLMFIATGFDLALVYVVFTVGCLMMAFGAFQVPRNSAGLTLDADGFRQRISLLHTGALWKNVSDFEVATIYSPYTGRKAGEVIWYHDRTRESWWPHGTWKRRANAGINPVQELSIEQLADMLKRWRDKALTQEN